MARPLRPQIENGIYHVFNRGNARQRIFEDDDDRRRFITIFLRVKRLCDWGCLSYCLMVNHYHLVLRTPRANLARGMARLNSAYAQAFNRRHERVGHLFQGRYGARLVQADEHLLTTLRYVALNPVESLLCRGPDRWPWSGHAELLGLKSPSVVDVKATYSLLSHRATDARLTYAGLFADPTPEPPLIDPGEVIAGDARFAERALTTAVHSTEMPRPQRFAARPGLRELFRDDRDAGLIAAYYEFDYSQREIADFLECHYSTVSRWLLLAERRRGMWQRKT
jgi:putative transposase